ncbi:MAG: PEP-CTERM sorting domain-containing protein [Planctomycetes bacterium]|nr:PEP-CTERM sorting domain-containing protein [Planctomycetota bacterium]
MNTLRAGFMSATFVLCVGLVHEANAAVIDFEMTPGGATPVDDAAVGGYTVGLTTVSFGTDTDNDGDIDVVAHFEDREGTVGPAPSDPGAEDPHGYTHGIGNQPYFYDYDATPGKIGGDWMIRPEEDGDDIGGGTNNGVDTNMNTQGFLIVYSGELPVSASGEIWDIDSNAAGPQSFPEQYTVKAFASVADLLADNPIGTQVSPLGKAYDEPGSLSGLPWTFSFANLNGGIAIIQIFQNRTAGHPRGFAFDNFNATEPAPPVVTPEPASWAMMSIGGWLLLRRGRAAGRSKAA